MVYYPGMVSRNLCWLVLGVVVLAGCGGGGGGSSSGGGGGASVTIATTGGTYALTGTPITLIVPAGAVSSNQTVSYSVISSLGTPPSGFTFVNGTGVSFAQLPFGVPITVQWNYSGLGVADASVPNLTGMKRPAGLTTWSSMATTVDTTAKTASMITSSLGDFALAIHS
jgi:hypothetical protein